MSVFFISDLHLGHRKILDFEPMRLGEPVSCLEAHDEILVERILKTVNKRDILWVLGDVAFSKQGLAMLADTIPCRMKLVRGNHDQFAMTNYSMFEEVLGLVKYKGFWLSHAPIHPAELRGIKNIHGHVHSQSIPDERYINVCVEALSGYPVNLDHLREFHHA